MLRCFVVPHETKMFVVQRVVANTHNRKARITSLAEATVFLQTPQGKIYRLGDSRLRTAVKNGMSVCPEARALSMQKWNRG